MHVPKMFPFIFWKYFGKVHDTELQSRQYKVHSCTTQDFSLGSSAIQVSVLQGCDAASVGKLVPHVLRENGALFFKGHHIPIE